MIWFILGITPFVIVAILCLLDNPWLFLTIVGVCAFTILTIYGAWQMGWIVHCSSNFWELVSCP